MPQRFWARYSASLLLMILVLAAGLRFWNVTHDSDLAASVSSDAPEKFLEARQLAIEATLPSDLVHTLQHVCFLGSALLFWWALIHGPQGLMGYGTAVLYVFTTSVHSGVLGALITFARKVWYPAYNETTASWGLTALEDQQLGGLIMWVPAGLVYIVAGLALCAGWMRESERRVLKREAATR